MSRDAEGIPIGTPPSTVLRVTTNSYYNDSTSASSSNVYTKRLTATATPLILSAPQQTVVGASQSRFSYDNLAYGTPPTLGNLTKVSRWDDYNSKWIDTTTSYDGYGNVLTMTAPSGTVTTTTTFIIDSATHAQPTQVTVDPQNGTGAQTAYTSYDYATGLVTSQTDVNGQVTDISYLNQLTLATDVYGRPGYVLAPPVTAVVDGTTYANQRRKVVNKYFDNARQVETIADLNTAGDGKLKSRATVDQLGRAVLSESSEDGASYTISAQMVYVQMGRITKTANPHRSAAASRDGWTRTTLDDAGRVVEVATFGTGLSPSYVPPDSGTDGNWTGSVTTTYNAHQTTVTDQAGKSRRSQVDGVGRLQNVVEDPNGVAYLTSYSYDALGNLTQVLQGVQTRTFTYDSLSRLRTAKNPEQVNSSGTRIPTVYDYNDAGSLIARANPNGTSVSFQYDGLNRVKQKTLSSGGVFSYNYDTGTNGKGRLVSVKQASNDGYYYDGYDAVGKVTASHQITDGNSYALSYGYNLAGAMTQETYPSGRVIKTAFDNAGRISQVSGTKSGEANKIYASQFSYSAHGAALSMTLGNSLIEHTIFNSRLQPTEIGLGTTALPNVTMKLEYDYGTTANNGNLLGQTIRIGQTGGFVGTTYTQTYSYDSLNRLKTAQEGTTPTWKQEFDYDQFGNRRFNANTTANVLGPNPTFDTATNRIAAGQGYNYDTSGNLTDEPSKSYGYDAENHQTSFNSGAASYVYDGNGWRVKKIVSSAATIFVYNAAGQMIAEYGQGNNALGGGTSYLTSDHLGSTRVVTQGSGDVKSRQDYLPFGEESLVNRPAELGYGQADNLRQKFTAKERDNESGLDYFGMRYYGSAQGRFTSVDPLLESGDPEDPQSLNRYTYTFNNPLKYIDPTGGLAVPIAALTALASQQQEPKRIKFEQVGQVKILSKNVAIYVATGQTKEFRDTVLKNAQSAADMINSKAGKLSAVDRRNISNITAIVATGQLVQPDEQFYAEGVKGVDPSRLTNEGTDLGTGTFFTTQIVPAGADVFASQIGHEGKHVQDYKLSIGAYAPRWGTEWTDARSDFNERRTLRYQLGLYRKLSGSSAKKQDGYDKYLEDRIANPHRLPALKK